MSGGGGSGGLSGERPETHFFVVELEGAGGGVGAGQELLGEGRGGHGLFGLIGRRDSGLGGRSFGWIRMQERCAQSGCLSLVMAEGGVTPLRTGCGSNEMGSSVLSFRVVVFVEVFGLSEIQKAYHW